MLLFEPNVVVIDDKKNEVDGILKYYWENGIGCKYYNAGKTNDNYPDLPFSDVCLVFLDIYFSERTTEYDAELCTSWIQSIIPEKSFYVLIIWSKEVEHKEEILSLLNKYNRAPFICLDKSKVDYVISGGFDFNKLNQEIEDEINKLPAISELGIWKRKVKYTSNTIIGHLSTKFNNSDFTNRLKKIILSHGGKAVKDTNIEYKRAILFDALDNILISNTKNSIESPEVEEINKNKLYDLNSFKNVDVDKELNSWFHFKINSDTALLRIVEPGMLFEFKDDNIWHSLFTIKDDKIISELIGRQIGDKVAIKSIALLLTRPCDIAQDKFGKNYKLLSGLKVINPQRKENEKKDFQCGATKPDSVIILDHLFFNDNEKDVTILFDYRYVFSVPEGILIHEFIKSKIFNKEILSDIQVSYSSYSSRLGITQII